MILDLRMPVLSGLETYLELKRQDLAMPTVIVTAYPGELAGDLDRLKTMPIGGIMTKPFDPKELINVVERLAYDEKE